MTLIKRHFVRFKHCLYLTRGRWKGGQGGPHFGFSEAHCVVLVCLEVNEEQTGFLASRSPLFSDVIFYSDFRKVELCIY